MAERLLPYCDSLDRRSIDQIDLVVIHCTETPDLVTARRYGEVIHYSGTGTGNSGHFYIDRDGSMECWVPESRIAHHTRGYNERSIGIELVNRGRYPHWLDSRRQDMTEDYSAAQISALCDLLEELRRRIPSLQWIAGHEDLDRALVEASDDPSIQVHRKRDPGARFPWQPVLAATSLQKLPPEPR